MGPHEVLCSLCYKRVLKLPSRYVGSFCLIEIKPDPEGYIRVYPDGTWLRIPTAAARALSTSQGATMHKPHVHA